MNDERTVVCDACGETHRSFHQSTDAIDTGWILCAQDFGYYGGFSDDLAGDTVDRHWNLCHDCIVTLLTALPRLGERLGKGQHPSVKGDKPCCRWSWIFHTNDDGSLTTLVATDDGQGWQVAEK